MSERSRDIDESEKSDYAGFLDEKTEDDDKTEKRKCYLKFISS
jgi:hypothetical protein